MVNSSRGSKVITLLMLFLYKVGASTVYAETNRSDARNINDGYWDVVRPSILDQTAMNMAAIISGLLLIVLAAHLYLLLYLMIDILSAKNVAVTDKKFRRNNIPKIILDRVGQTEEYDDLSWDEFLENELLQIDEILFETEEKEDEKQLEIPEKEKNISPEYKTADFIRWLKTIYSLVQINEAMQMYMNIKTELVEKT